MSVTIRILAGVLATVAAPAFAAGCGSATRAEPPPPCLESLLAQARGYALDPGLAMAITTAMTYDHPELSALVAAVADYQAAHPDTGIFEADADDADVASLAYVLFVADLADQPAPGDVDMLHEYENAARVAGMAGVYRVLEAEAHYPDGGRWRIPHVVRDQLTAVRQAGVFGASQTFHLGRSACGASDEPG